MKVHANPADKTNFLQSLMHMIKGNLGTGILAMPASFNHCGLVNALVGLPILCLIATYCVHLLVRSSQHLESKRKWTNLEYAELAKGSFQAGPRWLRPYAASMRNCVDAVLIICQVGICCVYLVFIVDNVASIMASYQLRLANKNYLFLAILPIALLLSYIKTLRRLAIASACANLLQVVGLGIVIEYLIRDMPASPQVEYFKPASEVALGFGSAMFAFEGISVVLPIYTRMKRQKEMNGLLGLINISYFLLLVLYMALGLLGYLRFGSAVADSITLNLPKEPLYDVVRAIFTTSLFLSYPLQFYVPHEIIWSWVSARMSSQEPGAEAAAAAALPTSADDHPLSSITPLGPGPHKPQQQQQKQNNKGARTQEQHQLVHAQQAQRAEEARARKHARYEYYARTALVALTFVLAVSVPKLNLMMDFFGSISGTALSITLPPLIHLAAFWEDTRGLSKLLMVAGDSLIILIGLVASANGSYFSFLEIVKSFSGAADAHGLHQHHATSPPPAVLAT